jgi:dihydrolipoamide dehydrogenase
MKTSTTRLLIIGGGPGGYVAAIRAAQLGIPTTLVEGADLGGTCLNIGCIPSKALIHAADFFETACLQAAGGYLGIHVQTPRIEFEKTLAWKDGVVRKLTGGVDALLKKNGVQVIKGWAQILDGKTVEVRSDGDAHRLSCEHLLLATGSTAVSLPSLPFGGSVVSSTEALSLRTVPRQLIVVGAGYIGLELGIAFRKLGAEVTVVEAQDRVLPAYDAELTRPVAKSLQKLGLQVLLGTSVQGISEDGKYLNATDRAGKATQIPMGVVLVAVGRLPRTKGMGLESLQLDMSGRAVKVDDQCRTSMRNVWAIGDLTGEPMLAHRAMAQGEMTAEIISGKTRRFTPRAVPAVCFTDPEVVVVGLAPDDAKAAGMEVTTAHFPLAANGRSLTIDSPDGFVRVVARSDTHAIVGWQAVGRGVSELSSVFAHSIEMGERLEDAAGTIHAHPTVGEAIQEAALRALGHAIHI